MYLLFFDFVSFSLWPKNTCIAAKTMLYMQLSTSYLYASYSFHFLKHASANSRKKYHMEKDQLNDIKIKQKVQFSDIVETFDTYSNEVCN